MSDPVKNVRVPALGTLRFFEVASPDRASLSSDFTSENCFGIYVYKFTDDMYYVGKSIDVRDRHVSHLHEYAKLNPPRIIDRMWWAPVKGTDLQLDFAETQVIAALEAKGHSLTNTMKTGRPRGNETVMVDIGQMWGLPVPWEREQLPKSKTTYTYAEDPAKREKFETLAALPEYDDIIDVLSTYVCKTIAAPADTAGKLWIATAMPTTNGGKRICCISTQNAETLVLLKGETWGVKGICGFINTKKPEGGRLPKGIERHRGDYGTLPKCYQLCFPDLESMRRALNDEVVLDCCYRANAELMRRGTSMYKRYNNPYLVEAILNGSCECESY